MGNTAPSSNPCDHRTLHLHCRAERSSGLPRIFYLAALASLFCGLPAQAATAIAARFAVPVLCTETPTARTHAKGTGIIVDPSGIMLTAAHVVSTSRTLCALTVMVPEDDWGRSFKFHTFSVQKCVSDELLDIALCHIQPVGTSREWAYLQPARLHAAAPQVGASVSVTGFSGWGFLPVVATGPLLGWQQFYRRQDGCYCDFAVATTIHEGMSGGPIVTAEGQAIGLVTTAGTGRFRGISFGTSFERAAAFLRKNGLLLENPAIPSHASIHPRIQNHFVNLGHRLDVARSQENQRGGSYVACANTSCAATTVLQWMLTVSSTFRAYPPA